MEDLKMAEAKGLSKPVKLKSDLAAFLGAAELPRTEITKKLWDYIKENKLQTKTENGKPENVLELIDKKKLVYTQSYYYDNGNLKEQGSVKYNKAMFDYERIGVWKLFDKDGNPTKQQKYINGVAQ